MSDLNTTAKSDATADVKNSTVSEPAKTNITGIPVQNESNSKEIGTNTNSTNLQPGNSRELTKEKTMSVKAQGLGDDLSKWGRYAWDQVSAAGRYITDHIDNYRRLVDFRVGGGGNSTNWQFSANLTVNR